MESEVIHSIKPQFHCERERLKSFENWPVSFLCPSIMAAAGFYFLKREDIVRCAFCGVEIGHWVTGDNPLHDHERWSPSCGFVRKLPVGNVPISTNNNDSKDNGYDTCGRVNDPISTIGYDTRLATPTFVPPVPPAFAPPVPFLEKQNRAPLFPNFATHEARIYSYKTWPTMLKPEPKKLSEAGFFYTGREDQTICFYCGGGLRDWNNSDEPWVEHVKWFPKCKFVLLVKGINYDKHQDCGSTRQSLDADPITDTPQHVNDSTRQSRASSKSCRVTCPQPQCNVVKSEEVEDYKSGICKICYTDEVGVVFLPCGHLVTCVKCAPSLTVCAICRQSVMSTIRVFLS